MSLSKLISEWQPLATILVAVAGGLTSFFMDREYTWGKFIVSIITAGFSGYLVYMVGVECGLRENMISILCGISGLSGEAVLRVVKHASMDCLKQKVTNFINNRSSK